MNVTSCIRLGAYEVGMRYQSFSNRFETAIRVHGSSRIFQSPNINSRTAN